MKQGRFPLLMSDIVSPSLPLSLIQPENFPTAHELQPYRRKAEQSATHRLLEALLREQFLSFKKNSHGIHIPLIDQHFLMIRQMDISSLHYHCLHGSLYYFASPTSVPKKISKVADLLDLIKPILLKITDAERLNRLAEEIKNHVLHETLTFWKKKQQNQDLTQWLQAHPIPNFYRCLESLHGVDTALFLEQYATQGHPYHPCRKTKMGLSDQEVWQYSPEFHGVTSVYIAALRSDCIHVESAFSDIGYKEWFSQKFPESYKNWRSALSHQQETDTEFTPIPLHPWQVEHEIKKRFKQLLQEKKLYIFESVRLPSQSTLSFRTVVPMSIEKAPHIKLAIGVQSTSAIRIVLASDAITGPQLSRLLNAILKKESYFNHTLRMMPELFGLHVLDFPEDQSQHLVAIFRDHPGNQLQSGELGIVLAALFEPLGKGSQSLLSEILEAAGVKTKFDILNYFRNYAAIIINSYLKLYLKYGIALEAHQQNTFVVFKDARPISTITRDFESARIDTDVLARTGYAFTLAAKPSSNPNNREAARIKLLHTTYEYHLGAWINHLSNIYKIAEMDFWPIVRELTEQLFESIKPEMDEKMWAQDRQAILKDNWPLKALLRMRLAEDPHKHIYLSLKNPLQG